MRYFQEVDPSEICYAYEAAEWIVRGRVPIFAADEDGNEIRGDIRAYDKDYILPPEPLTQSEIKAFAVGLTYDDYLDAILDVGPSPDEFLVPVHQGTSPWSEKTLASWREAGEERMQRRKEQLDRALFRLTHQMERAKAQVMAALLQGSIIAEGFWFSSQEEFDDRSFEDDPPREVIPHELISPSAFDWDMHSMKCIAWDDRPAGVYCMVTLRTRQVLETFSPPLGEARGMRIVNSNAILEDDPSTPEPTPKTAKRPRGRPYKTEWIREGMRSWYHAQCTKGKAGTGKLEADIADAMAWAKSAGVDVSRTTVQNYIGDLLR